MPNPLLMQFKVDGPALLDVCVLAACWVGFGVILVIGKRGATKTDAKRSPISHLGFLLQLLGYAICFAFPRRDCGDGSDIDWHLLRGCSRAWQAVGAGGARG